MTVCALANIAGSKGSSLVYSALLMREVACRSGNAVPPVSLLITRKSEAIAR